MSTVMKISPQGQIRIPKKVMAALNIVPGDYVAVDVESGHVILKPRKLIDPAQGWYWTEGWQRAENEVDEQMQKGQCSPEFQTAEEGLKWLDE